MAKLQAEGYLGLLLRAEGRRLDVGVHALELKVTVNIRSRTHPDKHKS